MIELAGVVRADLQALRESMEAIACGELARNDDAVAGIESSNRPRQCPTADRPTAIAHPPVDASPNGHRYDGTIAVSIPSLARAMLAISRGESSGLTRTFPGISSPNWRGIMSRRCKPSAGPASATENCFDEPAGASMSLMTMDRGLRQQQNPQAMRISVLVVRGPSNRVVHLKPLVGEIPEGTGRPATRAGS